MIIDYNNNNIECERKNQREDKSQFSSIEYIFPFHDKLIHYYIQCIDEKGLFIDCLDDDYMRDVNLLK